MRHNGALLGEATSDRCGNGDHHFAAGTAAQTQATAASHSTVRLMRTLVCNLTSLGGLNMGTRTEPLKLLCDTNVFIAAANIHEGGTHPDSELATQLIEAAHVGGHDLYVCAATTEDLLRDTREGRRRARLMQLRQWKRLARAPVPPTLASDAGYRLPLTANDQVDLDVLTALRANAADLLVTQDRRLRQAAARIGLAERVKTIQTAVEYLGTLAGKVRDYPTVEERLVHELDQDDPIFDSLKADYADFEGWFSKACREHRRCLIIRGDRSLEALAILKEESDRPHDISGSVLKVCTFKVAEHATGSKRGELVLKVIFNLAREGDYDSIYVEVFPTHTSLVGLLDEFGFRSVGPGTDRGELVLVKNRRPPAPHSLEPLEYHRLYGPHAVVVSSAFLVPIVPRWHDELFPEGARQMPLFAPGSHGNAIRKAYLSHAPTTQVTPGAVLLFYRSHDLHAVTAVGVVEETQRLADAAAIRRAVGQRTVYTDHDIEEMAAAGPVLVILFRQDRLLDPPWPLDTLREHGVLTSHPQSIMKTDETGLEWIREQLHE